MLCGVAFVTGSYSCEMSVRECQSGERLHLHTKVRRDVGHIIARMEASCWVAVYVSKLLFLCPANESKK